MATFNITRVTALPDPLEANTAYLVSVAADKVELYVTGNNAVARRILNEADIQALIDASVGGIAGVEVVDDIAARDALSPTSNVQVFVIDASADATVASGGATYIYRLSNDTFYKISEAESLDFVFNWSGLQGGPSSTPVAIDQAVANSHTHANKTQLDQIGQNGDGDLTYNGHEYVRSGTAAW
ncbi:MAG: hypothetical protein AAFY42_02885 [Pseudomonadota bacterium]